jgi:hypothetical protein
VIAAAAIPFNEATSTGDLAIASLLECYANGFCHGVVHHVLALWRGGTIT